MRGEIQNDRKWLKFRGKDIRGEALINALDWERSTIWSLTRSDRAHTQYCHMIYPMQRAIDSYMHGDNEIDKYVRKDLKEADMKASDGGKLPDCIEGLFDQIEATLNVKIPSVLEKAEKQTAELVKREAKENRKQENLYAATEAICEKLHLGKLPDEKDTVGQIRYLCSLMQGKVTSAGYVLTEAEETIFSCWNSLLARKLHSDCITYEQMKDLEQNELIESDVFTDLIRKAGEKHKDYEWYEEDFMGQRFLSDTIIQIDDVLKIAEPIFRKGFGIREA